jgi:hypothetical protein
LTKHLCNPLRDLSLVQCLLLDDACSTQKKSCVRSHFRRNSCFKPNVKDIK